MSLRAKKRVELRKKIIDAAVTLYLERGLLETTTTDIATAADISRRTFFYYFPRKDDLLVGWYLDQAEFLVDDFETLDPAEPLWTSLEKVFVRMRDHFGRNDQRVLELYRFIQQHPKLMALKFDFYNYVAHGLMTLVMARSEATSVDILTIAVLIQTAIAAYMAANEAWARDPSALPFHLIAKRSFELSRPSIVDASGRLAGYRQEIA